MQEDTNNENKPMTPITLGQKFKEARIDLNLSIADVSDQLRIFKNIIESIESGSYASEDMTIFVKGYIRNYARLLKIPETEIGKAFTDFGINIKEHKKIETKIDVTQPSLKDKPVKIATYIIIITLIILVSTWYYTHRETDSIEQTKELQQKNHDRENFLKLTDDDQIIETEEFD